ncbi:MAG: alanine racemase C-terminal domain-containing protein, partial [Rubrivivax sp.]
LSPVPQAGVGSEVTLWGRWERLDQRTKGGPLNAVLPIDEVAHAAGTIGYELMCGLAHRVPVSVVQ